MEDSVGGIAPITICNPELITIQYTRKHMTARSDYSNSLTNLLLCMLLQLAALWCYICAQHTIHETEKTLEQTNIYITPFSYAVTEFATRNQHGSNLDKSVLH